MADEASRGAGGQPGRGDAQAVGLDVASEPRRRAAALGLTGAFKKPLPDLRTVMGITFPNPVGMAAGLDKDGAYIDGLAALGFGFIEVGTVTPRAQPGNADRIVPEPAAQHQHLTPGQIAGQQPVIASLRFRNASQAGLGVPLPSGRVRVFDGKDFLGDADAVGKEHIDTHDCCP